MRCRHYTLILIILLVKDVWEVLWVLVQLCFLFYCLQTAVFVITKYILTQVNVSNGFNMKSGQNLDQNFVLRPVKFFVVIYKLFNSICWESKQRPTWKIFIKIRHRVSCMVEFFVVILYIKLFNWIRWESEQRPTCKILIKILHHWPCKCHVPCQHENEV